ncbi:MAG: hypothetical protein AAF205_00195 [Pseudomonadota bacterium]
MSDRTKVSHTPGPWRFSPYYDLRRKAYSKTRWNGIFEPVPDQDCGHKSRVLSVGIEGQVDDFWISCSEANARLIEAAPGLYEALADIGVYGCGMLNQPAAMNGPEEAWLRARLREYERVARTALAKAEAPA